uniref:Uncharacterized protein n=1 Tax=Oryza glumipatula TaxID=40148 RepID=A0A0E0B0Q3_9ORYZ
MVHARTIIDISSVFPYTKMVDANTHAAIAVVRATGARTTYVPSAKATARLRMELRTCPTAEAKCRERVAKSTDAMPAYMSPSVACREQTNANALATMNASNA